MAQTYSYVTRSFVIFENKFEEYRSVLVAIV